MPVVLVWSVVPIPTALTGLPHFTISASQDLYLDHSKNQKILKGPMCDTQTCNDFHLSSIWYVQIWLLYLRGEKKEKSLIECGRLRCKSMMRGKKKAALVFSFFSPPLLFLVYFLCDGGGGGQHILIFFSFFCSSFSFYFFLYSIYLVQWKDTPLSSLAQTRCGTQNTERASLAEANVTVRLPRSLCIAVGSRGCFCGSWWIPRGRFQGRVQLWEVTWSRHPLLCLITKGRWP